MIFIVIFEIYNNNNNIMVLEKTIFVRSVRREIVYLVGKTQYENFDIIDASGENDVWFHIEGFPSGHVIARIDDLTIDKKQKRDIVTQGAVLCKQYSKYKSDKNVKIVYTMIKNIQKTEVIGQVRISNPSYVVI